MRAQQVTGPEVFHGEGPVWHPGWGGLRFVDMLAGDVMTLRLDGGLDRRHVGSVVAAVRPRQGGGAVLGVERGFALEAPDGTVTTLPEVWDSSAVRMNEGGCDPAGNLYLGSMAYDGHQGGGSLYRFAADHSVTTALAEVTVSNGLDWSPDGSLAYYNDTELGRIDVFDWSPEAGLHHRRAFAAIEAEGGPDGLTVDAEGGVWTALYGGSAVQRYAPDGRLDLVVEVPCSQVTSVTFGGPGLSHLYITTSREGLDEGAEPLAGSLFTASPGVAGQPVREYAG